MIWKEEFGEKNVIYDVDWGRNGIMVVGGMPRELFIRKFEKAS